MLRRVDPKLGVATLLLCPMLALAAPQNPPSAPATIVNTPSNPVPVAVQGTVPVTVRGQLSGNVSVTNASLRVDALNDILNEPYLQDAASAGVGGIAALTVDVPDGKRLIVETVTVRAALASVANAVAQFNVAGGASGDISLQAQGIVSDGGDKYYWLIGVHPMKMRVDAVPGSDHELTFFLRSPVGIDGTWAVFVSGYLVPLPN
jgi:hypothetical protein